MSSSTKYVAVFVEPWKGQGWLNQRLMQTYNLLFVTLNVCWFEGCNYLGMSCLNVNV